MTNEAAKTIQDWINEYYPHDASPDMFEPFRPPENERERIEKDIRMVKFSIKKWKGLKNLPDGAYCHYDSLYMRTCHPGKYNEVIHRYNTGTCPLCREYFYILDSGTYCKECPIKRTRGKNCCEAVDGEGIPPYNKFLKNGNPDRMIECLELALEFLEAEKNKKMKEKKEWLVKFHGRKVGADGIRYDIRTTVEAPTADKAREKIYERYEHCTEFSITEI